MFDEIEFDKIKRLPKYVFAAVMSLKWLNGGPEKM